MGGDRGGEERSAHAEFVSVKYPPAPTGVTVGIQVGLVGLIPRSRVSSCGVDAMLVGPGEIVAIRGGRMEKIWSPAVGGPYESNGSGIAWSIGSIIGSDLQKRQ
jgi:hypothetical protein